MTFEEWWKAKGFINGEGMDYAEMAWQAATLAEREARAKVCDEQAQASASMFGLSRDVKLARAIAETCACFIRDR